MEDASCCYWSYDPRDGWRLVIRYSTYLFILEYMGDGDSLNIFDFSYWFGNPVLGYLKGDTYFFICAVVCLMAFLVARYMSVRYKKHHVTRILYPTFLDGFLLFSITGFVFGFLHYEGIYLFSSRIWFLIYQVSFFLWFIPRVKFVYRFLRGI